MLDLRRIESQEIEWNILGVNLTEVVVESIALCRPLAAANNIEFEARFDEDNVVSVKLKPIRAKQVAVNFLSNAVNYNRPGGKDSVFIETIDGGSVRMIVHDTGIGIASGPHCRMR